MKILYLSSSKGIAGSSIALFNLVKGISQNNEVYVVARNQGEFIEDVTKLGVKTFVLPSSYLTIYPEFRTIKEKLKFPYRFFKYLLRRQLAYKALLKIVQKIKPNIIHTNVGPWDIGFKVAKKLGIKHIWHLREYQDLDFNMHFFPSRKSFLKMLQYSNNHSIAITQDIFKYWSLSNEKDKVVYDGVIGEEEHLPIINKKKYFLFVGRIDDSKGAKSLLHVFAQFANVDKEFKLLLAGKASSEYQNECNQLTKHLNIDDRVRFLGVRTDVYELMEQATALIVPSRNEGFGFITAEAMYNHCLVIGRNTAGTKEQFDIGLEQSGEEIGLRFNHEKELLDALIEAKNLSKERYKLITESAYNIVKSNYTINIHIKNIQEIYANEYYTKQSF